MHGCTVLITGATGGIGYETARVLAAQRGAGLVAFLQADHSTVGGNDAAGITGEGRAADRLPSGLTRRAGVYG